MRRLAPVVTLRINGRIVEAICPKCHDPLPVGKDAESAEDQEDELEEAFRRHLNAKHPNEKTDPDDAQK